MSTGNTKFALNAANYALATAGAALCNDDHTTYVGAPDPPVGELPGYPLANLLTFDRRAVAVIPAGQTGDLYVDVDLGAARSITAVGLLGLSRVSGTEPNSFQFYYSTSSTYPSSWTSLSGGTDTPWSSSRDVVITFSAVALVRFIRVKFTDADDSTGFSVGKLFVGNLTDLGLLYAPGAAHDSLLARSRVQAMDGGPFVTSYGPTRKSLTLTFMAQTTTVKDYVVSLGEALEPFLFYLGTTGTYYECLADVAGARASHRWGVSGGTDIWDIAIALETLY